MSLLWETHLRKKQFEHGLLSSIMAERKWNFKGIYDARCACRDI